MWMQCFSVFYFCDLRCHAVLDARLVSKLQIKSAKGGEWWPLHIRCPVFSSSLLSRWKFKCYIHKLTDGIQGLVLNFSLFWRVCSGWKKLGHLLWTLDWAPCEGEEINLDLRVIYSCINPRTCIITASCTGAWSRGVSTSSERHSWLFEQVNRKKYVVLTK